jgi:hypothetical protein
MDIQVHEYLLLLCWTTKLWWRMREKCQRALYSFPSATPQEVEMSEELCNELSALTYDFDAGGAIQVESKRQAKLRGVASPNIADALGMTEYYYSTAHIIFRKKQKKENKRRFVRTLDQYSNKSSGGRNRWMAM